MKPVILSDESERGDAFRLSGPARLGSCARQRTPATRRRQAGALPARLLLGGWLGLALAASVPAQFPTANPLGVLPGDYRAPAYLALDPLGRIAVSDASAKAVEIRDAFGRLVSRREGLQRPAGVGVDSQGRVYVAEQQARRVAVYDASWNLVAALGAGDGEFAAPNHLLVDEGGGVVAVLVTDSGTHQVKAYTNGLPAWQLGGWGTGAGQFRFPAGLAVNAAGEILVVDSGNERVQVLNRSGGFIRAFSTRPPGALSVSSRPQGVTVDAQGRCYVADSFQGHIKVFDASGVYLGALGALGDGEGQLRTPHSLGLDRQNRLWISSVNGGKVSAFGVDCFLGLAAAPASQAVGQGTTVTLSVSPSCAGPITYQWRRNGMDLVEGGVVLGATSNVLSLRGVTAAAAGAYTVRVSGPHGAQESAPAILEIIAAPVIVAPPAPTAVTPGSTVVLAVHALGAQLRYRWLLNGLELGAPSASSLTIPSAQPRDAGNYQVVVSNPVGAVTSAVARLSVLQPPRVTVHPTNQTVPEGGRVSLSAAGEGSPTLRYAWYVNNTLIAGQNNPTLTLTQATPAQSGDYFVVITNEVGAATSGVARVVVVPDTVPPRLLSVSGGRQTNLTLVAVFSKPLAPARATNLAYYELLGPATPTLVRATLSNATNVILTLSGPRVAGSSYLLRVRDLTDTAYTPNVLDPNPTVAWVEGLVSLVSINTTPWKYYQTTTAPGLDGVPWTQPAYDDSSWSNGFGIFYGHRTNSVNQPAPNPAVRLPLALNTSDPSNHLAYTILNVFTNGSSVLREITYYFRTSFDLPGPTNGVSLYLHSMVDDGAVFYLNGRELRRVRMPGGAPTFTTLANSAGNQNWEPALNAQGTALPLNGLQTGRNTLAVEVHQNSTTSSDITLGVWLEAAIAQYASGEIQIVQQPQGAAVQEGQTVTLQVAALGELPLAYQWHWNGQPLPGATQSSLLLGAITPPQGGAYQVIVSNRYGMVTSAVAQVSVTADTTPPVLLFADGGRFTNTTIVVSFSEAVDPASAQTPANYTVAGPGALEVLSATLTNSTNVLLTLTGPRTPNQNYQLRARDIKDRAYQPNLLAPNPAIVPVAAWIELLSVSGAPWRFYQTTEAQGLDGVPWAAATFDDGAWPVGYGLFYGNRTNSVNQPAPNPAIQLPLILNTADPAHSQVHSILNVFTNGGNAVREITYYFRSSFVLPANTNGVALWIHTMIDDGAVIYLNGQEIERLRMPAAPAVISASTLAASLGGQTWEPAIAGGGRALPTFALRPGTNVLAVELHQGDATSSDVTLGVRLEARVLTLADAPPELRITRDAGAGLLLDWDSAGFLLEAAPGLPGPWTVAASNSPVVIPPPAVLGLPAQFFRLRQP